MIFLTTAQTIVLNAFKSVGINYSRRKTAAYSIKCDMWRRTYNLEANELASHFNKIYTVIDYITARGFIHTATILASDTPDIEEFTLDDVILSHNVTWGILSIRKSN